MVYGQVGRHWHVLPIHLTRWFRYFSLAILMLDEIRCRPLKLLTTTTSAQNDLAGSKIDGVVSGFVFERRVGM